MPPALHVLMCTWYAPAQMLRSSPPPCHQLSQKGTQRMKAGWHVVSCRIVPCRIVSYRACHVMSRHACAGLNVLNRVMSCPVCMLCSCAHGACLMCALMMPMPMPMPLPLSRNVATPTNSVSRKSSNKHALLLFLLSCACSLSICVCVCVCHVCVCLSGMGAAV